MWEAGPELDCWLVRNLFREFVCFDSKSKTYQIFVKDVGMLDIPKFSTDTDDAMIIVDYWRARGFDFKFRRPAFQSSFKAMFASHHDTDPVEFSKAVTEAHAICLASVAAFERITS